MEYIYACIIPFRQFSPCTTLLCMVKHGETAQEQRCSSLQSCKGDRSNIPPGGVANNTPYYGCCTLSGLLSESKARSFSQKLNVVHASLRE